MTIKSSCLLCGNNELEFARKSPGTRRGAVVHVCPRCGLLQSRYGSDQVVEARGDGMPRPSCLADYGNLRTGKGGRANHALDVLAEHLEAPPRRALDVGSSRGHFVRALLDRFPDCEVDAVEPDARLLDRADGIYPSSGAILIPQRIEHFPFLGVRKYDLIHCSHTLEHLFDPLGQLCRLADVLTPGGLMYVEVPDVGALMERDDLVEEIFLDKHVTHWTEVTLMGAMVMVGLLSEVAVTDGEHLWVVGRLIDVNARWVLRESKEHDRAVTSLEFYGKMLATNTALLEQNVPALNERLRGRRAVVVGAGRILDALRRAGLDLTLFEAAVDSASPLEEFHGLPVVRPPMLAEIAPDVALVCSRSAAGEIASEVMERTPGAEIIYWNELLKGV